MAAEAKQRVRERKPDFYGKDSVWFRLFDAAAPAFLADRDGKLTYANRALADLLGFTVPGLTGLRLEDLVHSDDLAATRAAVDGLFAGTSERCRFECRLRPKGGEGLWVVASATRLPDERTGVTEYVAVLAIDIDSQRRVEADRLANESRWNAALEAAGQGVWDHDRVTGKDFYSAAWRTIRGLGADEEVDTSQEAWLDRVHPDDRERVRAIEESQESGETPFSTYEYRERHRDGHYIWILSRGSPIKWFADGRPSRIIGTDTDITDLKRAQEELQFANTLLRTQTELSPDGILVVDADLRIISFNERFAAMWGISLHLLHARDDGPVLSAVTSAMKDPEAFKERVRYLYAHPEEDSHDLLETIDGRSLDRHSAVLRAPDGKYLGRIWFFRDRTEEVRRARERELQSFRFEAALNNMIQGLCMFDRDRRLVVSNRRYVELYHLRPQDVRPGMLLEDMIRQLIAAGNHPVEGGETFIASRLAAVAERKPVAFVVEFTDGRVISTRHQPLADGGWLATHEEITEQRRNQMRIQHLARYDALTDLPNRTLFREQMEQVNARIKRGEVLSVLYIDLDGFKGVNDTFGHAIGDTVLSEAAKRLRDAMRETDIVARLGGDEFAVVEGHLARPDEAAAAAARIVKTMARPFEVEGHHVLIGASVGIAVAPVDGTDADTLMKHADLALYRAKEAGRSTYHFYETGLDTALRERRAIEGELRRALIEGEFRLVFQPLLNLTENRVCAFEALLRWEHPTRGYLEPSKFISIAEASGMIVPIGEWVLMEACTAAAKWPVDIAVAVNLSAIQFRKNRRLVEHVKAALAASGLDPSRLEVEITETVLLSDSDAALQILRELKALSVKVVMDDFGTGYSSLSYLRRFPFDKIKIDQSFVQDSSSSADGEAIVRAVIGLGRSLGMTTTAEGVETEDQLAMIREQGCTEVQGYLFSAPLPASALDELLARFRVTRPAQRRRQEK